MTSLGPFLLGTPWALAALIALPVIWWVLRATPPAPKDIELPSLRLLDGVEPREETPARTPWWVWLIRTLAVAAAILGLSQPVYAPGARMETAEGTGSLLIIVDNGWASAPRWPELINAASATLDTGSRDAPVHLLLTAPQQFNPDPAERVSRVDMDKRLSSLRPQAWAPDRQDALKRLKESGFKPDRIFWASDGLESTGGQAFATELANMAPLTVFAGPPPGVAVISGIRAQTDSVSVTARRASPRGQFTGFVSALTLDGSALATAPLSFADGETEAVAEFKIPAAALARISRFNVTGQQGAGTVWLWDSSDRSRRVGLVDAGSASQPLLSDMHYIRKALEPFATISEGSIENLVAASPDAIIMSDIGQILPHDAELLHKWVEDGGALIRFAGPRLAAQGDDLLPVALRRSSRALGGALAWDEPQAIAPFPEVSPFAGLKVPPEVRIRQQVLARPGPELASKTWARLADGSPLVTADQRGKGMLILFHITAGPDWADLAYSGTFSQMLRRSIAAGQGEAVSDPEGSYTPMLTLDGYGRLSAAGPNAAPMKAADFGTVKPSEAHPPGLYQGPAGSRALNAGAGERPALIMTWPVSARLLGDAEARSLRLAGPLLGFAALLLAMDLFIALSVSGRLPRFGRKAASAGILLAAGFLVLTAPQQADAQAIQYELMPDGTYRRITADARTIRLPNTLGTTQKEINAALDMRLAYVETPDRALNERTRAGLFGLSNILRLRTSVEPAEPDGVNLETDSLELYPLIYFNIPDSMPSLSEVAITNLNTYLRSGGALVIDTRAGGTIGTETDVTRLETLLEGLDAPPLQPVAENHVLTRSFYLLDDFPGRYAHRRLWIEQAGDASAPRGDGVSRLFIGDADWASAWAIDERGRDLYSVDGGEQQREMSRRFGVNLVMYVLTGNYKDDQVHLPALLERLGEGEEETEPQLPTNIYDGGPR
ncbi:DUF4159 domain-containing protein [Hyphomonas pacifica]|uniref:DUF4159 domain-containing protein n=1 Tax=Hyphomonas pacifica TaxID=1280941 RepID=A0A062U8V6_9PROT|nr:DUF4159 domain-containing protein [Hyphomonas pacifica]KCZ53064.1 hypothetical protein HY2_00635 [Hyphomonas pacifica]RAN36077.1 hypothetical protein HY3_00435 [Hyphomonas pacifica]RAN37411.1 hypothetical protein HY11_09035 [Hyphomonas pacifica]